MAFFDLLLFVFGVSLFSSFEQPQEAIGAILLVIDAVPYIVGFFIN